MIISHEYRYVFIEIPLTGSWAVHLELCNFYDGTPILDKHSTYRDFVQVATQDERTYFAFASVRNPLDKLVSRYFKLKTDHKGAFSNPNSLTSLTIDYSDREKYKFVQTTNASFAEFFRKYYTRPYGSMIDLSDDKLDFVIRYEHLQEDFSEVLRRLDIEQVRPLPVRNKTGGEKPDWQTCYTPDTVEQAKRVCGPFMKKWGYEFPREWGDYEVSRMSEAKFHLVRLLRGFYLHRFRYNESLHARLVRRLRALLVN